MTAPTVLRCGTGCGQPVASGDWYCALHRARLDAARALVRQGAATSRPPVVTPRHVQAIAQPAAGEGWMGDTLEQVIADAREELPVLRRNGAAVPPDRFAEWVERVARAAEEFTRFVSEDDARMRSGHAVGFFRARFPGWEADGHAYKRGRVRYYRLCVIPRRGDVAAARRAGLAGESPRRKSA